MISYCENLIVVEQDHETIVIVPAEDVLLIKAHLPKLNRRQLMQALPFALEEQLIDDVANLHFAVLSHDIEGTLPVAVIAKEKITSWLTLLKEKNISLTIMLPLTLALPYDETSQQVYALTNHYIVRTEKFSGFVVDKNNLAQLIDTTTPIQTLTEEMLAEKLSQINFAALKINLLQGEYAAKRKPKYTKNFWKLSAQLAAVWITLVFLNNLISFFILHHEESQLNHRIAAIYQENFPQSKNMIEPRERMAQKLKSLESASQKNNFLTLLASVAEVFAKHREVRLLNLNYQQPELTLAVSTSSFDALDAITRALVSKGLTVKQENAETINTQVKATLLINAGVS